MNSLALVGAVMAALNPLVLWDVGFQLSFAATLAAQVTSLPVVLYHFGRLSPVLLLANPVILPALPAFMMLAGLGLLAAVAWLLACLVFTGPVGLDQ